MKSLGSPRRMWALIGAAGTVAIVALGWVLLISGEKSRKSDLENQVANAQVQTATDRGKIAALQADNKKLPIYRAQLSALRKALPASDATKEFTADMYKLYKRAGVTLTQYSASQPTAAVTGTAVPADAGTSSSDGTSGTTTTGTTGTTPAAGLSQLTITLSVQGTVASLERFQDLLQHQEPRAVVVTQSTLSAPLATDGATPPTLQLTMTAFVAA